MIESRIDRISQYLVSTQQMRQIEEQIFAAGMPVAALMEKVGGAIAQRVRVLYPRDRYPQVGVLVGAGHNGGDALVVARELHFWGYDVAIFAPLNELKELTQEHYRYLRSLGVEILDTVREFADRDVIIDGLFGFGLNRDITGQLVEVIEMINRAPIPVASIDLPSGINTDTGEVLGAAIRADITLCLGLWKLAFVRESALDYIGRSELIDFDIPLENIESVIGYFPPVERMTKTKAIAHLPLRRSLTTHKYKQGHLLLIVGSTQYAGAAILAGLGARATGVGMLSIAVPKSLKPMLLHHLPEALIIGCPETKSGTIKYLPNLDFDKYNAIACGCGLTTKPHRLIKSILPVNVPLILDADALNIIAEIGIETTLITRRSPTIVTPHLGEFKRLFPKIETRDRILATSTAAQRSHAIVLLKGAKTAIANPDGRVMVIPDSTPALARGGSGDVLTGLMGGLIATQFSRDLPLANLVATAAWWHSHAGILAARDRQDLGVDPLTLTQYLTSVGS
jgi:NAD(P)H-hydrate epimerase